LRRISCSQFFALFFSVRKRAKPVSGFAMGWGPDNLRDSGKIAVKVINHYGDEVLKVFQIG
jgi:hypothetical protein